MNKHHKHASAGVAQVIFDGMSSAEQAEVRAEADRKGVSAVEIVRLSLDVLIAESNPASLESRIGKTSRQ
jgi:hypothetical protein